MRPEGLSLRVPTGGREHPDAEYDLTVTSVSSESESLESCRLTEPPGLRLCCEQQQSLA